MCKSIRAIALCNAWIKATKGPDWESQHIQPKANLWNPEAFRMPILNYSPRIHKISFSLDLRPAVFRQHSSTTPDINFGDEFGNKRENKDTVECAGETIAAGKDACLLPKKGSSSSNGDSLVSHYSSNSRLTPEVTTAPAVGRRSTVPRK